jgi:predicted anti-sigma-YlaC factor YlaD
LLPNGANSLSLRPAQKNRAAGNNPPALRDYRAMDCEVAREALSARLDDEREPVPSARVDEHLGECAACRAWFERVADQADVLRRQVQTRPVITPLGPFGPAPQPVRRHGRMSWQRWALLGVGLAQVILATAQGLGLSVGLAHNHGISASNHLLNESTSWSVALAVAMIGSALWPRAAAGLAGVLTVFAGVLTVYVVVDSLSGAVSAMRILTHIPVVIGAVLALLVWRSSDPPQPVPAKTAAEPDIVLPQNASRGRRRGHLWPTDGSAA